MHDALVVHRLHSLCDLQGYAQRAQRVHAVAAHDLAERGAAQELHDEVGAAVGQDAEVGDVDDVRVADLGGDLRLQKEAALLDVVVLGEQDLDRHRGVEHDVARLEHDAHAASPDAA